MAVNRSSPSFSSDNLVIKSATDKREYRIIHLKNGLVSVLIHDPEIYAGDSQSLNNNVDDDEELDDVDDDEELDDVDDDEEDDDDDDDDEEGEEEEDDDDDELNQKKIGGPPPTKKAAAALCVNMGSFSDPFEAQGLAHFLEHMLFMGSKEFPDENEYDSYLSKHGGSSNAYTETEYTCYHFEVNREYLKGALKRFSQFFISPLVKAEAMEREVMAVDSEFNQVLQNDSCRLQQLQCHTSSPGHLFNRFFWGNKKSLYDAVEKGVDLRERILHLYKEYYHGGAMKLVVIGGEPLDMLEDWVMELFSDIKEGQQLKLEAHIRAPIWKSGQLYRLEAVKEVHSLNLTWTLPSLKKEYLKKPDSYLANLLGHEGNGSLHAVLKSEGWITSLSAGIDDGGMDKSSVAYIFGMCIHLTDSGLEKVYDVIGLVYQYIKLLREASPQKWLFNELQDIGNMEFKFAEEQAQDDYASELAVNLLQYSEEHIICGDYVYDIWDENLITQTLSFLNPDNMRVDILSKSFDKLADGAQYEPWFGSRFVEEDIPVSLMKLWLDPPEINSSLHLPAKNEFIPQDFSLRDPQASQDHVNIHLPYCLIDLPWIKLWYKLDDTFRVPRANTYFLIALKGGYDNVKSCVLTELFVTLLKDELNEIIYQADIAKLSTSLSILGDKLELKLYGFNDKLSALLSKILAIAKSFKPAVDRFKVLKEEMERGYRNTNIKPLNHASYSRLQLLRKDFWDVDDKLHCLTDLSLADLLAFIPNLFSQMHIECLCHGNLSREEAISIADIFKSNFSIVPLPLGVRHEEHVICFPPGANLVRDLRVKNKLEVNSVVEAYFQIEQDIGPESNRLRTLADLFDDIINEPLFDQLRTKEQLGYVVQCSVRVTYRVLGFCFCVQSSEYNPVHLHGRIDNFLNGLQILLNELDEESFENYRSGLIAKKLEKDPSLSDETSHLWGQIVDKRYLFDMSEKEAQELKSITKNEVVEFYNTYFKPTSEKRRRVVVRVWGCNTDMTEVDMDLEPSVVIEDFSAFKNSAKFYPSFC